MVNSHANIGQDSIVKGLFADQPRAERAFHAAQQLGYTAAEINLVMSEETRQKTTTAAESDLTRRAADQGKAPSEHEVGGPTGATVATIAPALAAIGTVLLIPGIVAMGPIAVALTAAGAMGIGAGVIGALTHWGIPSHQVGEYEAGIRRGGILLAVHPRNDADRLRLIELWQSIGGESVHA
jgi:hypothetical protein